MNNQRMLQQFKPKGITRTELYTMGIPADNFTKIVDTLDELRKTPPNIMIAECKKSVRFIQNKFKEQEFTKKHKYVMSGGIYMQLHWDTRLGKNGEILKPSEIQFKNVYRPYMGQDLTGKKLLVFRQGGIGDLLFIQPNLIYLKEKYPSCIIKFACGPQYQSMVKEWDCVDQVIDLPFDASELFQSNYHCVFEGVIERCKQAENEGAYNLFTKWMGLNLSDELLVPKQEPKEESNAKNREILKELNIEEKDFIVLQMRASSIVRTPNPEVWIKLVNMLTNKGHNILITDSPHLSPDIDLFISKLENKDKVKNYCQYSSTIADTISIISMSKLVISTDSATPHIAESVNTKSFALMGSFPGRVRFNTYKNNDWIDVSCDKGPCYKHGSQPCKNSSSKGYSLCYENLDYNLCIEKIERLLNK